VREGAKACVVEAEFRLAGDSSKRIAELLHEWGLEFDGEALIIRREVSAEGRSRASVNQSSITLANLKRLGELLLDLHGQHEHQSLLRDGAALATLDRLGGLESDRAKFADTLAALREAEGELARLRESLVTFAERAIISRAPLPSSTRRAFMKAKKKRSRPKPHASRTPTACASSRR